MKGANALYILCLVLSTLHQTTTYETIENACNRCNCIEKKSTEPVQYYVLDCKHKGLTQSLATYPDLFGLNHTGKSILIDYSENNFNQLKQLAPTDASVIFICEYCGLTDIEAAAFIDVPNIVRIDLSYNNLSEDSIRADIFRGRYNDQMYEPINLIELDLIHNRIKRFTRKVFEHTTKLQRLSLRFNPFKEMDDSTVAAISSLHSLKYLDLSYTDMITIPKELFKNSMPNLRELDIKGNLFTNIPGELQSLGPSLSHLHIGFSAIEKITNDSFVGFKKLTHLFISEIIPLKDIAAGAFLPLISLEVLNCSRNTNLTEFNLGSLVHARNLKVLDISKCGIQKLNMSIPNEDIVEAINSSNIIQFSKLKRFMLDGNPWHCDCDLYKTLDNLVHFQKNSLHFESEQMSRCATPYELATDLLEDLLVDPEKCLITNNRKQPRVLPYEPPAFLRPRSILISLLSVLGVVMIGLVIGLVIVFVKKKLQEKDIGFVSPIRYTTVRNSTIAMEQ